MEDTSMINSVGDVDTSCVFYRKGAFPKIIIIIVLICQRHFPVTSVIANSEKALAIVIICQNIPFLFRNLLPLHLETSLNELVNGC